MHDLTLLHDPGLFSLVRRRWRSMGLALAASVSFGGASLALTPPTYQATAKLMVTRSEQRMGGLKVVNDALPDLTGASHPLYTQVELLRITPVFQDVIKSLDLRNAKGRPLSPEDLALKVRITPIDKTDLIEVQYEDPDPAQARAVVSAICDTYVRFGERYREQGVREGLHYVDAQMHAAKEHLDKAERNFQRFKQGAGTADLPIEVQADVTELSGLNASIREQEGALAGAHAKAAQLRSRLGTDAGHGLKLLSMSEDPRVKQLKAELTEAESSPLWSAGLKPDHPELAALNRRVGQLRTQLAEVSREALGGGAATAHAGGLALNAVQVGLLRDLTAAEADAEALRSGLGVAHARRAALLAKVAQRPGQEIRLRQVTRELDVASGVYQGLLQKREEARVNLALAPNFARVIEPASLPDKPLSPLKGPAAPVVAVLGLAAAFGVGATRDLLTRRAGPEERALIQASTAAGGYTVMPGLPALGAENAGGRSAGESPDYEQALDAIVAAIEGRSEGDGAFVLGVTSLRAGEGKTTCAVHLADQLATRGERVLVVEADFRKPRLAEFYGLEPHAPGLTEVLLEGLDTRHATRKMDQVDVVTAGAMRFTPSLARLVKKRVMPAVAEWRRRYDYVIIDLPPIAALERTREFALATHGLIVLVNQAQVSSEQLLAGIGRLQAAQFPVLGLVPVRTERGEPLRFPSGAARCSGEAAASRHHQAS